MGIKTEFIFFSPSSYFPDCITFEVNIAPVYVVAMGPLCSQGLNCL